MNMSPSDRLIVALDGLETADALALMDGLASRLGVRRYKIGASNLITGCWTSLPPDFGLMVDLKIWDTPWSVARIVRDITNTLRPEFITVHPSVLRPAIEAACAFNPAPTILPVPYFSSDLIPDWKKFDVIAISNAGVCPAFDVHRFRESFPSAILVCPGIADLANPTDFRGHRSLLRPSHAVANGATHVVVGRPIVAAPDPVAAARRIIDDIASVSP